ncbi:hypothetical protein IMSAGC002_01682 [Lachnospiraceae bacterium]|nr:hypothetical protein IMSAGC002_01682 [Lachnospiraceae bacterium]
MYNRYHDIKKFVTDPEKLQIVNGSEVYISSEEDYDIVVDLKEHKEEFESLKPFIAFIARNICELDNTAQKFNRLHSGESRFPFDLELIFIDVSHVILEYWGTEVNTQFGVVFEYSKDKFTLKKFGMIQDIPADWEQAPILKGNKSKQDKKKSFLHGIIHWM